MRINIIKITGLLMILSLVTYNQTQAQRMKKVRIKSKVIAYNRNGRIIDSLSRSLYKQSKDSRYLDQVQVDLRKIEQDLQKLSTQKGNLEEKDKNEKEKDRLLKETNKMIHQIQGDKQSMVREYYIVVESVPKNKKQALVRLNEWYNKGYNNPFLFYNKVRKWYYICTNMYKDYNKAYLEQYELQKKGVDSWLYYWVE